MLYLLIENIEKLEKIRNMESKNIVEIEEFLHAIAENGSSQFNFHNFIQN